MERLPLLGSLDISRGSEECMSCVIHHTNWETSTATLVTGHRLHLVILHPLRPSAETPPTNDDAKKPRQTFRSPLSTSIDILFRTTPYSFLPLTRPKTIQSPLPSSTVDEDAGVNPRFHA